MLKNSTASAEDTEGTSSGSGRSPGRSNGNPLQYSCLENPMDREAWQTTVHRVSKSQTQLKDWTHYDQRRKHISYSVFPYPISLLLCCYFAVRSSMPFHITMVTRQPGRYARQNCLTLHWTWVLVLCTLAHQSVSVHTMAEKNRELDSWTLKAWWGSLTIITLPLAKITGGENYFWLNVSLSKWEVFYFFRKIFKHNIKYQYSQGRKWFRM